MASKVFDDGLIQLWHGDALDVIEEAIEDRSVSTLLTDPPFGQNYIDKSDELASARGGALRGDNVRGGMRTVRRVLAALSPKWTDAAHLFVFHHFESGPDFFDVLCAHAAVRNQLVWWKRGGSMGHEHDFARDLELIFHATRGRPVMHGKREGCVLDYRKPHGAERYHPTQKPVPLLRHLASKAQRVGDPGIVLDPFAGSSSTLVACRQLGLRAVGIEIDSRWIEPSIARLNQTELFKPETARGAAMQGLLDVGPDASPGDQGDGGTGDAEASADGGVAGGSE